MEMDQRFGDWLAGFTDGEGCFSVFGPTKPGSRSRGGDYGCVFRMLMRFDERPILDEIQRRTGLGTVSDVRGSEVSAPGARWEIHNKADCLALVRLFDCHSLRAKKAQDFALWRIAVLAWNEQRQLYGEAAVRWRRIAAEVKAGLIELHRVPEYKVP